MSTRGEQALIEQLTRIANALEALAHIGTIETEEAPKPKKRILEKK